MCNLISTYIFSTDKHKKVQLKIHAGLSQLNQVRFSLNKDKYQEVNLYFEYEARFKLMNHLGKHLTVCGVKPINLSTYLLDHVI
jgi:hypothetical protein